MSALATYEEAIKGAGEELSKCAWADFGGPQASALISRGSAVYDEVAAKRAIDVAREVERRGLSGIASEATAVRLLHLVRLL